MNAFTESFIEEATLAWLEVVGWRIVHCPDTASYFVALPLKLLTATFSQLIRPSLGHLVAGIHETHIFAAICGARLPKLIFGELHVNEAGKFLWRAI